MEKNNQSPKRGQQSVKFRAKPLKGPSFVVDDFAAESNVHILSDDKQYGRKKSTSQSSEVLSTAELISAVGQIWDCATRSLARFQPEASVQPQFICQKDDESYHFTGNDKFGLLDFLESRYLYVDLKSSSYFSCMVHQSLECFRLTQEIPYKPFDDHFIRSFVLKSHTSVRIPYLLMNSYRWMSPISPLPEPHFSTSWGSKKIESTSEAEVSDGCPLSECEVTLSSNSKTVNLGSCSDTPHPRNQPLGASATDIIYRNSLVSSLHSDYFLQAVEDTDSGASISTASSSGLHGNNHLSISAPGCTLVRNGHELEGNDLLEDKARECESLNCESEVLSGGCSSMTNKPHPLLAKQEHAVSGALAGIIVSLCLHPIDTVKTVVQSCRAGQTSILYVGQSIISDRGLTGLYRGISSNITTSAPISAIYTFTYESVKGFLLPSLSKEYHSVAHCTAGACASIATSFIFTPSEHIKQQMQVNTHYRNCWNAVYRIVEKGGLPSLYAGWGAVLCRNIPHSIIKFYTYESLKQMFMSSEQPNDQPSTLQTLLCGGLAGSTAAMFSTPFDVVKTRFQTQIPGSTRRNTSILNTFQEICEHEGLKGLYRGLIPRLVMYMSQGALFFASYEFFKSLLSMEIPRHKSEMLQHKQDTDDPLLSL